MTAQARKGSTIPIEAGEYAELRQLGVYVVEKDFFPLQVRDDYLVAYPDQRGPLRFDEDQFIQYLIDRKLIRKVHSSTLSLGDMDALEMWFTNKNQN